MTDILIVGGGFAGLTAALYAARAGKKVRLIEKESVGGQIAAAGKIENYPGIYSIAGWELIKKVKEQLQQYTVSITADEVVAIEKNGGEWLVTGKQDVYRAPALVLSTGTTRRKLDVPGEEKLTGKGVSYCATCDGNFFRNQPVAVIGGGNVAIEDALLLSELCSRVYVIHRRKEFKAETLRVQTLREKNNVVFCLEKQVVTFLGEDRLESVIIKGNNGLEKILDVKGAFIAVGQKPETEAYENIVPMNGEGYFDSLDTSIVGIPGLFVAGDCRKKKIRQLTTAASDGTIAAMFAVSYLTERTE